VGLERGNSLGLVPGLLAESRVASDSPLGGKGSTCHHRRSTTIRRNTQGASRSRTQLVIGQKLLDPSTRTDLCRACGGGGRVGCWGVRVSQVLVVPRITNVIGYSPVWIFQRWGVQEATVDVIGRLRRLLQAHLLFLWQRFF